MSRCDLTLAPGQRTAVATVLSAKVAIITGGPGICKTTIIRMILTIPKAKGVTALLAARPGAPSNALWRSPAFKPRPPPSRV
jgi:exodeoxyribonuclease V alpha subunit